MDIQDIVQLPQGDKPERAIVNVPIGNIITNPFQPRKAFDTALLQELADSIKEYGVLQPLLVVPLEDDQYLLIAGERRLRASYIAEMSTVPVILGNYSSQEVAEIAMVENLQREDLHFFDEAEGFELLMKEFNITQENLAKRVGKKQSTIANKLRILKLDKPIRDKLRESNLTERHARALLKLEDTAAQNTVLQAVIDNELNVRQAEELIESVMNSPTGDVIDGSVTEQEVEGGKRTKIIRDVRIFINSVKKVVADIKKVGVKVKLDQKQTEEEVIITMRIPLNKHDDKQGKSKQNGNENDNVSHETTENKNTL